MSHALDHRRLGGPGLQLGGSAAVAVPAGQLLLRCIGSAGLLFVGLLFGACGGGDPAGSLDTTGIHAPAASSSSPAASASSAVAAAAVAVAVTARGEAIGPIAEATIPTTGDTLASADERLTFDIPTGALGVPTTIPIQAIGNESPGGSGLGYRLSPEGSTFASPVKLTFRYAKADVDGGLPGDLRIDYQDGQGRWNAPKKRTLDEAAKTLTVEATHFSDWSLLSGFQLRPRSASVGAGKSIDLALVICQTGDAGSDELSNLTYACGVIDLSAGSVEAGWHGPRQRPAVGYPSRCRGQDGHIHTGSRSAAGDRARPQADGSHRADAAGGEPAVVDHRDRRDDRRVGRTRLPAEGNPGGEFKKCLTVLPSSIAALGMGMGMAMLKPIIPQLRKAKDEIAALSPVKQDEVAAALAEQVQGLTADERMAVAEYLGSGFFPAHISDGVETRLAAAR